MQIEFNNFETIWKWFPLACVPFQIVLHSSENEFALVEQNGVLMWIEIFRTGTFTDSNGRTQTFTESDLEQIARQYNERTSNDASYEAPLVKGHPQTDSPAYGWVERLARRGNVLYAKLKSVSREIIEEINAGKFRRVSISLYPNLMLRHIGLLGGETPAVSGLRPISFVELDESTNFEYSSETVDFAELRQEIRRLENENLQLARQNEALRNDLQKAHHESLARSFRDFIRQVNASSDYVLIPPAREQTLLQILEFAAKADVNVRQTNPELFPEGFQLVESIKQFISELQPLPIKREFSMPVNSQMTFDDAFAGRKIDETRLNLHLRAKELQKENPELSYEQALFLANNQ